MYYIQIYVKQSDKEKLKIKMWARDTKQKQRRKSRSSLLIKINKKDLLLDANFPELESFNFSKLMICFE